jgi:hypothetical protein
MALKEPRQGESVGFHCYPTVSNEVTLADPETVIWSSIRQLGSRGVASQVGANVHGLSRKRDRQAVANNVGLYLQQAAEFYGVAHTARANTAPLIYYYSFLNLAKALCELKHPRLHRQPESYRHGVSWRASPRSLVNPERERITVTARGVWHLLWEVIMGRRCPAANPASVRIRDLFSYCPEVSSEFGRTYRGPRRLIELNEPDILYDNDLDEAWIRFSLDRSDLRLHRLSIPKLLPLIRFHGGGYREVRSQKKEFRTFQSKTPVKVGPGRTALEAIYPHVQPFNLFTHLDRGELKFSIPVQGRLPIQMPQIIILYSILFWLGSLVRYDPHSVNDLMDSPYWIIIDGFMSQSRVWLLELMEWTFYQTETTLWYAR